MHPRQARHARSEQSEFSRGYMRSPSDSNINLVLNERSQVRSPSLQMSQKIQSHSSTLPITTVKIFSSVASSILWNSSKNPRANLRNSCVTNKFRSRHTSHSAKQVPSVVKSIILSSNSAGILTGNLSMTVLPSTESNVCLLGHKTELSIRVLLLTLQ